MIRKQDYFKLGSFIILGTCMLVAVVIILGAGRYFKTTYMMESYFDESVNGLEIGSPVKLRGVQIGRVADINFVANKYHRANQGDSRYVLVDCEIEPSLFQDMDEEEFNEAIKKEVGLGLRVRPTSLGLTGQLFLNLVYADKKDNPPLHITWQPSQAYIPSMPSTLNRLEGAVTTISKTLSGIKQQDIVAIIGDVKSIVSTIDDFMKTEGGKEAGQRIIGILQNTESILARVDTILADPAMERLIPETTGTIASVNHIMNESSDDIIATIKEAKVAMESFRKASDVLAKNLESPRVNKALDEVATTLESISKASKDLTGAVAKIHALANRVNGLVASEESNIHAILQDTREVMQNIKELSGDAKRYPSGIIFGEPPRKATPDTK